MSDFEASLSLVAPEKLRATKMPDNGVNVIGFLKNVVYQRLSKEDEAMGKKQKPVKYIVAVLQAATVHKEIKKKKAPAGKSKATRIANGEVPSADPAVDALPTRTEPIELKVLERDEWLAFFGGPRTEALSDKGEKGQRVRKGEVYVFRGVVYTTFRKTPQDEEKVSLDVNQVTLCTESAFDLLRAIPHSERFIDVTKEFMVDADYSGLGKTERVFAFPVRRPRPGED